MMRMTRAVVTMCALLLLCLPLSAGGGQEESGEKETPAVEEPSTVDPEGGSREAPEAGSGGKVGTEGEGTESEPDSDGDDAETAGQTEAPGSPGQTGEPIPDTEGETPPPDKLEMYSLSGRDSVILANRDVWYLEEFDGQERPVRGTRWEKGEITDKTSWIYYEGSGGTRLHVKTGQSGTTETEYDEEGRCIRLKIMMKDTDTKEISYTYDKEGRLLSSVTESGTKTTKIQHEYKSDGTLKRKTMTVNGELSLICDYASEDDWTETVYGNGGPILVVEYADGVRQKGRYERKY